MFGVLPAAIVADTGLTGKERIKAFFLQALKQGNGGNIGITVTAGFMFFC